jgi:hypothetical protein
VKLHENAVAAEVLTHLAFEVGDRLKARLDGVHVSDITMCARKAWYKRNGRPQTYTVQDKLLFMTGSGHHAILQDISRCPELVTAEIEVQARYVGSGVLIHNTVDLILTDPAEGEEILCEIKSTRASANKPIESSSHYIEQIACSCVILGATRARLYVLHLMGDYSTQRTPILRCWDLTFTPEEMTRWEKEMVRRHDLIVDELAPSIYEAYPWECGYCVYSEKKGGPCPGGGLRQPFFINHTMPERIPLTFLE